MQPILLLLFLALIPAGAALAADLKPFNATYSLSRAGLDLANVSLLLRKEGDDRFVYESETTAVGLAAVFRDDRIVERSDWQAVDHAMRPLAYAYTHEGSKKNRNVTLNFDWQTGSVVNHARGKVWTMDVPTGTLDKFLVRLALMLDLQDGREDLRYDVADGGQLKEYRFLRGGEETIDTPLGRLETVKIASGKFDRKYGTTFWCSPQYDYLPVRVERTERGALYRMEIRAVEGLTDVALRRVRTSAVIDQPKRSPDGSLGSSSATSGGSTVETISQESNSGI